jgi:heme/copper-type cytochrome/quinol oxidase subunit 1
MIRWREATMSLDAMPLGAWGTVLFTILLALALGVASLVPV